jgi:hypothetical protein
MPIHLPSTGGWRGSESDGAVPFAEPQLKARMGSA